MGKEKCGNCRDGYCMADEAPCLFQGAEELCADYVDPGKLVVRYIGVDLIDHHPDNPRKKIGDISELAESIRAEGIQQPLTLVPHVEGKPERYTAVIGHRRLEAAKQAGLWEVPAFVREMSRREQLRTMLTENGQREDLTPLEEADGFQQLMLELPEQTVAAVARETGFGETTIRRRMNLLKLDRTLVEQAETRNVTLSDYEKLGSIRDEKRRNEVLAVIGTEDFLDTLEEARDEEKREKNRDRLVQGLVKRGAKEITWETWQALSGRGEAEAKERIYSWRWRDSEDIPALEAGTQWRVCATDDCIWLIALKERRPDSAAAEDKRAERERRRLKLCEELGALNQEMTDMADAFRADREEFVGNYDSWTAGREEIMAFAVRILLMEIYGYQKDRRVRLADWLDIPMAGDQLDERRLRQALAACPEKVLLYTAYLAVEGKYRSFTETRTDYKINAAYPVAVKAEKTTALYQALEELGYHMSAGEKQWQRGVCPQYILAQRLMKEWREQE